MLEQHMNFCKNLKKIVDNYECFKNIDMKMLHNIHKNFKIVKILNGRDFNWYVLQKRNFIFFSLSKIFKSIKLGWYVSFGGDLKGSDRNFYYSNAITTTDPVTHLIHTIPNILRAYLENIQYDYDRPGYPNGKIVKELKIYDTIANCKFNDETDLFHCLLENSIIDDYEINKITGV